MCVIVLVYLVIPGMRLSYIRLSSLLENCEHGETLTFLLTRCEPVIASNGETTLSLLIALLVNAVPTRHLHCPTRANLITVVMKQCIELPGKWERPVWLPTSVLKLYDSTFVQKWPIVGCNGMLELLIRLLLASELMVHLFRNDAVKFTLMLTRALCITVLMTLLIVALM